MFGWVSALLGGDHGIYQTVAAIKKNVAVSLLDGQARIRLKAEAIIGGRPERDQMSEISALYEWAQEHFRYVNDPVGVELIKTPDRLQDEIDAQGYFSGDCDDASTYLAALLLSVGYPVQLVVVAPEGSGYYDYQHIYLRAYADHLRLWVSLDLCARGRPFGWEVPHTRERTWELRP